MVSLDTACTRAFSISALLNIQLYTYMYITWHTRVEGKKQLLTVVHCNRCLRVLIIIHDVTERNAIVYIEQRNALHTTSPHEQKRKEK